ncbi:MAG: glycosyltransferase [Bdellovibrionales bacterium]
MPYRLFCVKISATFVDMVARFLAQHADFSFGDAVKICRENGYMYPGSFTPAFESLGVEVMETLIDSAPLQNRWRQENGLPVGDVFDKNETFFAQIRKFKPDVVYFQTFFALAPEVRKWIKKECPSVKLVVGHRGFPLEDAAGYEDVDAVFLGYPKYHDVWHKVGVRTFDSLHAFDSHMLPAIEQKARQAEPIEFSFIGHTGWGSGPHDGRYFDLCKMMDNLPLTVYGHEPSLPCPVYYGLSTEWRMKLRKIFLECFKYSPQLGLRVLHKFGRVADMPILVRAAEAAMRRKKFGPDPVPPKMDDCWWHHVPPISRYYPERFQPSKFGIDYLTLLAASKVTWNRHQDTPGAGANMRLFEACGVGTCQLVDAREEVVACYEPGVEIVTYHSIEECLEKARWLLDNPAEREKIAKAGQRRTLAEHTSRHRALEIHDHLTELLRDENGYRAAG